MKSYQLAKKAELHSEIIEDYYGPEIEASIQDSYIYSSDIEVATDLEPTEDLSHLNIYIENLDTVSAIFKHYNPNEKMATLNFADFTRPGGLFMDGGSAQEEMLCHNSFLYNVLTEFEDSYYKVNHSCVNDYLYADKMIYSSSIMFFKDENLGNYAISDVITCAAPNLTSALKRANFTNISNVRENNSIALNTRTRFILDAAESERVDTLILGAWGCGVFGQNPLEVSQYFKKHLYRKYNYLKNIIFAIPFSQYDFNLFSFYKTFCKEESE